MERNKVNLSALSAEDRAALSAELKAEEAAARQRVDGEREAYKRLVSDAVEAQFPTLQAVSAELARRKAAVYEDFRQLLAMKSERYDVRGDQRRHTFTNGAQTRRITLGYHQTDAYDDTVNEGIAKVKAFIGSMARDGDSRMLVEAVLKLLSRDQQGNLKASRVVQLQRMAEQSGDASFVDGVRIIREAYRPAVSKQFVRAEAKNEAGAWQSLPLGMTEA